jgi:hypothetical protein
MGDAEVLVHVVDSINKAQEIRKSHLEPIEL